MYAVNSRRNEMAKRKIGIGIIGFGNMGMAHSYSIENLKFFAKELTFEPYIVGVCTRSAEKSRAIAEKYGFPAYFENEDALINDPRVDVVDICTPNNLHLAAIEKAKAAGKYILSEKPLCPGYSEARLAADGISKTNGIVFNNRHLSAVRRAKEIVEEGRLGRILSFDCTYFHNSCLFPGKSAGWKQSGDYGAGVLRDLGSHAIDLIYYLLGDFDSVFAKKQIAFPERLGVDGKSWQTNADEAVYITAKLSCGAIGTVRASKLISGANDDLSFEINGEKGSLRFSLTDIDRLYYYDGRETPKTYGGDCGYKAIEAYGRYPEPFGAFPSVKATQGWLRGHMMSMYSFLEAVANDKEFSPSLSDGAYISAVIECADISDKEGRFVSLSEVKE